MQRRDFIKKGAALSVFATLPITNACTLFPKDLPTDIIGFNAVDLSLAIRNKTLSCVEVMKAYLKHIHTYNPVYNAIVSMEEDEILIKRAAKADTALARGDYWGWMHGMPHAIKDLAPVKGMIFTSGSPMFSDRIAAEDSELVKKIHLQRFGYPINLVRTKTLLKMSVKSDDDIHQLKVTMSGETKTQIAKCRKEVR